MNPAQLSAVANLKQALDFDALLPNSVFSAAWGIFRFFESHRMFESNFVEIVRTLLAVESAKLACMINVDRSNELKTDVVDALFIDGDSGEHDYNDALREGGPQGGWLFDVDRYACSSEKGAWCIYCEKSNEVAVLALRNSADLMKYERALQQLDARPVSDLLGVEYSDRFPFNRLVSEWRDGLARHYGRDKD
ncbi:hypothetical protein [Caballeronia sp. GAWG2-1]|uniref:hypothetical protein n=1 Tax=Caballeronia sp. GAWG2-1 TaxID=2921744 RepID=UPI002027CFCD|nr:hypothetical protein [Caballeronia sp. GAWG2-1]